MEFVNIKVSDNVIKDIKDMEEYETDITKILETGIHQIRIEQALSRFKQGSISIWKAAKMARVPLREMIMHASAHGIKPNFDEEMIGEETAEKLNNNFIL